MKNDNDLILERLRGVPANKPSWRDKIDAGNPNVIQTNDNQPTRAIPSSRDQKSKRAKDAGRIGKDLWSWAPEYRRDSDWQVLA